MKTYFEIFTIPKEYSIDLKTLEENYIQLQSQYHPDKFINQPEEQRLKIAVFSEQINKMYEILKDDIKRGEYILNLSGYSIFSGDFKKINPSQALLGEFMTKFEDYTKEEAEIESQSVKNTIDTLINQNSFEEVGIELLKLKFLTRIINPWIN